MVFIKKIYFYDYSKYFMISNEFGKIIVIIIQVFLLYSFIGKKNTRTLLLILKKIKTIYEFMFKTIIN